MSNDASEKVLIGQISGVYGVRGWVKVYSYTSPKNNIIKYQPWLTGKNGMCTSINVLDGRQQGKGIVAKLEGIEDRDRARELVGQEIYILRRQLPSLGKNEFYWSDLIGLNVEMPDGRSLGKVHHLLETGSNDVLVVRGDKEYLIPFLLDDVVIEVKLEARILTVDWDPDF
ncbi:MAG: ribosome maturation factor RimM [Gammaproteobacteria bacterium]